MSDIVNGNRLSVNAAHKAMKEQIGISVQSVYNKLNGIESHISEDVGSGQIRTHFPPENGPARPDKRHEKSV